MNEADLKLLPCAIDEIESGPVSMRDPRACAAAAASVGQFWPRFLGISAVVLLPCFWHRHIVASDLGSHLYNAWLAHLIQHGQAPGLWLSGQWTNVLFDWMLAGFGSVFGLFAAEKIAVSICVLVFFWGAFALIAAANQCAPWLLIPLIAMFAYGWTFHIGLYNYYLSIGLSFFCLAIFWRGTNWERISILPVAVVIAMAHPFGLIWLACGCTFIEATRRVTPKYQFGLVLLSGIAIWMVRYYLIHYTVTELAPNPLYFSIGGLDQIGLFGSRYNIVQGAVFTFVVAALMIDSTVGKHKRALWQEYTLPVQLFLAVELAVLLLPRGVTFPGRVPIALITDRLTSLSAVAGCCVLGAMRPSKWHLVASLGIAAVFTSFLYQDTGTINKIEAQAERLVRTLPPNQRVLASIFPLDDSRIMIQHNIDLACIGYCFDYGNYEPGSAVFRVRATPGNPYVLTDYDSAADTEAGVYVVQPEELPIYQVYQCTDTGLVLCIRPLAAGEENGRLGAYQQ